MVLFWQLSNSVNSVKEAKKTYPLLLFMGEIGVILGGLIIKYICNTNTKNLQLVLNYSGILLGISSTILVVTIYILLNHSITQKQRALYSAPLHSLPDTKQTSLIESLKNIASSKYLLLLLLTIISYNTCIILVEALWYKYIEIYTNRNYLDIGKYLGEVQIYTGITTLTMTLIASIIFQKLSWKTSALITPVIMLLFTITIFAITINSPDIPRTIFATIILIGSIQIILSKSCKYSFYDPSKEIAYIPLSESLKTQGKSAVDVAGSHIGKSNGSAFQIFLLTLSGTSLLNLQLYVSITIFLFLLLWFFAAIKLSSKFNSAIVNQKKH